MLTLRAKLCALCILIIAIVSHAFLPHCVVQRQINRPTSLAMQFGGGKKKSQSSSIEITVKQKFYKDMVFPIDQPGNLRKALMAKGIEIYPLQGKIYNCGGGGSCGTCAVNVLSGSESCSPKSPAEKKLLGNKPESYRLSCCTKVSGNVTVQTKP